MELKHLNIDRNEFRLRAEIQGFEVDIKQGVGTVEVPICIEIENNKRKPLGYVRLMENKITGKIILQIWHSRKEYNGSLKLLKSKLMFADGGVSINYVKKYVKTLGEWAKGRRVE